MSQGLPLVIFYIVAMDRAASRIEHVGMYCVASGPHEASYSKTSYTPTTYTNTSWKAQGTRCCKLNSSDVIDELVSFILASYHRSCLLPALLILSQLGLSLSYLWEMKQTPNRLLTCWKMDLCWLATQLAPAKLASYLLWIAVQAR